MWILADIQVNPGYVYENSGNHREAKSDDGAVGVASLVKHPSLK